jgi:hypothetical protein
MVNQGYSGTSCSPMSQFLHCYTCQNYPQPHFFNLIYTSSIPIETTVPLKPVWNMRSFPLRFHYKTELISVKFSCTIFWSVF